MTRTTLLSGPAAATYNGRTYFAHEGIIVRPALEFTPVNSDARGPLDLTLAQQPVTISFTPSAPFADLLALYPWAAAAPGTPLFGPADQPLILTAANGTRLTFSAVALIQMPDLHLTERGPVPGPVTFLALGARNQPISAANRLVTVDTAAPIPLPPPGTPQLADDFVIAWGAAPWLNLRARDGIRLKFHLRTRPVVSDANAQLDLTLDQLNIEATFVPATPEGPGENDVFTALQLEGGLPGRMLSSRAPTLTLAGDHFVVQLASAELVVVELHDDALVPRLGELTFCATRAFFSNAPQPLFTLLEGQ